MVASRWLGSLALLLVGCGGMVTSPLITLDAASPDAGSFSAPDLGASFGHDVNSVGDDVAVAVNDVAAPTPDSAVAPDAAPPVDAVAMADVPPVGHDFLAPNAPSRSALVRNRPYNFFLPSGYDPAKPTPLVMLLHGHAPGQSGQSIEDYFQLKPVAEAETFLYAFPDGLLDQDGTRFWNATDACCDFYNTGVDDVAYLGAVMDDVADRFNVDPQRIFIAGFSNGGFMAHRLGCDLSHRIAAFVSVSGANFSNPMRCQPTDKIGALEVHGTADMNALYNGGNLGAGSYPSAQGSMAIWATRNGCNTTLQSTGMTLDLVSSLGGNETQLAQFNGCQGGTAELWTIENGVHGPDFNAEFAPTLYGFLKAYPKP